MNLKFLGTVTLTLSMSLPSHAFLDFFFSEEKSAPLDEKVLNDISSLHLSANELTHLEIVTDNDVAFADKIKLIQSAKDMPAGQKTIDMVYYIYSDDYSTSVMNTELIAAAQAGVKVRLLVDLFANFAHQDTFDMLIEKGQGNIEVSYYGRPTRNVVLDAVYATTPCSIENRLNKENPKACANEKLAVIDSVFKDESAEDIKLNISNKNLLTDSRTKYAAMLLAGLYSKNPALMQRAIFEGQQLNPADLKSSDKETTAEDKANLKELVKLIIDSKIKTGIEGIQARLKLYMAFQLYGDEVTPVYNLFSSVIGIDVVNSSAFTKTNEFRTKDWRYLADFTHHKLLLVGGQKAYMGGRNVQDSYHMKMSDLSQKYTFMDTDIKFDLKKSNSKLQNTFDKLWNYKPFVASVEKINLTAPYKFVAQMKGNLSKSERISQAYSSAVAQASVFNEMYKPQPDSRTNLKLSKNDQKTATVSYLENLIFSKDDDSLKRFYGSKDGQEAASGRYIHEAWVRSLEDTCNIAAETNTQQDVIVHNAYFAPSSNLLDAFAKMIDGTWNCGNVNLVILTNSFDTTDLAVVNSFGIYALKALFERYNDKQDSKICSVENKCAQLDYFEYIASSQDSPSKLQSLHSKVTVFGDRNIMVGSANADYRSYMRDTNNALLVRNAPDLVGSYLKEIKSILSDANRVKNRTQFFRTASLEDLNQENNRLLDSQINKFKVADKMLNRQIKKMDIAPLKEANPQTYEAYVQQIQAGVDGEIKKQKQDIRLVLEETVYSLSKWSVNAFDNKSSSGSTNGIHGKINSNNKENKAVDRKKKMNLLDELFKFI